jgi:hypothetical protein
MNRVLPDTSVRARENGGNRTEVSSWRNPHSEPFYHGSSMQRKISE